jgi:hypothetical protein
MTQIASGNSSWSLGGARTRKRLASEHAKACPAVCATDGRHGVLCGVVKNRVATRLRRRPAVFRVTPTRVKVPPCCYSWRPPFFTVVALQASASKASAGATIRPTNRGAHWDAWFAKLVRAHSASTVIDNVRSPARKSTIGRPISELTTETAAVAAWEGSVGAR